MRLRFNPIVPIVLLAGLPLLFHNCTEKEDMPEIAAPATDTIETNKKSLGVMSCRSLTA